MAKKRNLKQPWQVAALIAEMMRRSKQTRARLSEKTLRLLAGRKRIETSIREQIHDDSLEYGYLLKKLEGGPTSGTVAISLSSLHATKPLKYKESFDDDERGKIRDGDPDFFMNLHESLLGGEDEDETDE